MKNRMDFPSRREHLAMLSKSSLSLDKTKKNVIGISTHRVVRWEKEFHLKWHTNPVCIHLHTPSGWCIYDSWLSQLNMMGTQKKQHTFSLPSSLFFAPDVHFRRSCERHKNQHSNRETSSFTRCVCSLRARENRQVFFPLSHHGRSEEWRKKRWHVRRCAAHLQRNSREGDSTNREIQLFSLHSESNAAAIE